MRTIIFFLGACLGYFWAGNLAFAQQINNKQVTLGKFQAYQTQGNAQLEQKLIIAIEQNLQKNGYRVMTSDADSRQLRLENAKIQKSGYLAEGYYKKNTENNLELFIQIYDPATGKVIDALSISQNIPELEGIQLDTEEMRVSDEEVIAQGVEKTTLRIRSNPNRKPRHQNIEENISRKPIGQDIDFPIISEDISKKSEEVFKLLGETEVVTASRTKESLFDVPASMVVISEQEIIDRGYTNLDEVFEDLPGFDSMRNWGAERINAYQRGYRTPFMQRTILMINGINDNNLYVQQAVPSSQYPLSNIKRIEVVYGPASALYGPNAFLGIINIITKDGSELADNTVSGRASIQYGSFNTRSIDAGGSARYGDFSIAVSGRIYESDNPDFSGHDSYSSNYWLGNLKAWGPMLYYGDGGQKFGKYNSPANNWGSIIHLTYKGMKLGMILWNKEEGFGPYYTGDRVQSAGMWWVPSRQVYFENTSQWGDKLSSYSLLLYRDSKFSGSWPEATPDWNEGMEDYSYISYSRWNTEESSVLLNQNFNYQHNNYLKFILGFKAEAKKLAKNYDIPGYWDAFTSHPYLQDEDLYPNGYGVVHSSEPLYQRPPSPKNEMPSENLVPTTDKGAFLVSIIDWNKFRFSPGVRYDINSLYGQSINPRVTGIYKYTPKTAFKLLYGEAFNEPPPIQLFGGWSGRSANPNLKPEKSRNYELIFMHQTKYTLNELSAYYSTYSNVIKEEAENAGERKIYGGEYKIKVNIENFITNSRPIGLYFYYTYVESQSQLYYDHQMGEWKNGKTFLGQYEYLFPDIAPFIPRQEEFTTLGDMAPHKVSLGANLPIKNRFNINLRGFYVGKRQLYWRNPLRSQGKTLNPHFIFNGALRYSFGKYGYVMLKVINILNHTYYIPGMEGADGGDNYYERSTGFRSSTLPQPGRYYTVSMTLTF